MNKYPSLDIDLHFPQCLVHLWHHICSVPTSTILSTLDSLSVSLLVVSSLANLLKAVLDITIKKVSLDDAQPMRTDRQDALHRAADWAECEL